MKESAGGEEQTNLSQITGSFSSRAQGTRGVPDGDGPSPDTCSGDEHLNSTIIAVGETIFLCQRPITWKSYSPISLQLY